MPQLLSVGAGILAHMFDRELPLEPEALYRSTRFQRLVNSAFLQSLISTTKVAELLQVTVDEAQPRNWRVHGREEKGVEI